MGLFGFIGNIGSSAVKVALTPLAVTKDVLDGEPFDTTGDLLESAGEDLTDAFDDLFD